MIWLTGCKGMLGREISLQIQKENLSFIETDMDLDITSKDEVVSFITDKRINWIINCAGYTAVDMAEDEQSAAFKINADSMLNLINAAELTGAKIIHFSTDYVFDGKKTSPYKEDDLVSPINIYGESKLAAENYLKESYDKYFVFRISWLYGKHGKNFVHTMLNLMKEKDVLSVVNDQHGSPTFTGELAAFIVRLIKDESDKYGIYHFSGEGETSWFEFTQEINSAAKHAGIINRDVQIKPVDSSHYPTKAKRPEYSYMSKEKLASELGFKPACWKETLQLYIRSLS